MVVVVVSFGFVVLVVETGGYGTYGSDGTWTTIRDDGGTTPSGGGGCVSVPTNGVVVVRTHIQATPKDSVGGGGGFERGGVRDGRE